MVYRSTCKDAKSSKQPVEYDPQDVLWLQPAMSDLEEGEIEDGESEDLPSTDPQVGKAVQHAESAGLTGLSPSHVRKPRELSLLE